MERKMDEWSKSQNLSSKQTDWTEPQPPPQAQTKQVNVVFTGSGKFDDPSKTQKDPHPPIIVNNKIGKDKPIKTSKRAIMWPKQKNILSLSVEGFEDAFKQGRRIHDIDADEDITLVNDDNEMFDVDALVGEEVFVANQTLKSVPVSAAIATTKVSTAITTTTTIPTPRKGIVITEQGTTTTTPTTTIPVPKPPHDKGKGIMIEEPMVEQVKPMKKLEHIRLNEELAFKLQAKEEEEERLAREKAQQIEEVNIAWQRRKHFVAKRAEEKRNKPPTKTQQKNTMISYLKNMEGWKHKDLKDKDFDSIKELFNKGLKMVNMFVDFRTELVEGSSKRACTELEQEVTKKQKVDDFQETAEVDDVQEIAEVDDDQEAAKIKELIEIVPDEEEVAINAIPLAVKSPSIVDWKIHKEGKKSYYQIIRANGSLKMYLVFSHMLKSFDREDLETLWKLVKAKHGSIRLEEGYERVLCGDIKLMFDPHVEDTIWRNQKDYRVLDWKIYDSCRVQSFKG
ncbi:hypothetical protein Tco_0233433 [Tanacetum coccineum]